MKIIYFLHEPDEDKIARVALGEHELIFVEGTMQEKSDVHDDTAEAISIFVNSKVGAEEMDRFPKLKLISARSTGFDNVDLAEATKRGITVTNVPTYGIETVAEFAFTLLLALTRKVEMAHRRIGEEHSFSQEGLRGVDLAGKTIGVVGTGNIGAHVVEISKGFRMNILAYDPFPKEELVEQYKVEYVSLDDLISRSDIITLHVPLIPATTHLINHKNIGKIKRGAILINTARGGLVETSALVSALEDGTISAAGLDVLEDESSFLLEEHLLAGLHPDAEKMQTILAEHALAKHPRVIITPHIAFNTNEAVRRIIDTSIGNILAFAADSPMNVVKAQG